MRCSSGADSISDLDPLIVKIMLLKALNNEESKASSNRPFALK